MALVVRAVSTLFLASLVASFASAHTTWYVDQHGPDGGDGASWSAPFRELESALIAAESGDQIWVAAGLYAPVCDATIADPRSAEFVVRPGLSLFGGFVGNETTLAQRAGLFDRTVLSGDLGVVGDTSDNAYHVVRTWGPASIDGFAIVDGNGQGSSSSGGAIYCDVGSVGSGSPQLFQGSGLVLRNCKLARNRGTRGAALYGQLANLKVSLCTFEDNTCIGRGGAVSLQASSARFDLCTFRRNRAALDGGAVDLESIPLTSTGRPRVQFVGCLFHDNLALGSGGAAYLRGGSSAAGAAAFVHCTLAANLARAQGGGICAVTTTPVQARSVIENSIVSLNCAPADPELAGIQWAAYSIAPGQSGPGVLNASPQFKGAARRDFRLRSDSPGVDAGSSDYWLPDLLDVDGDGARFEFVPFDLALQPRWSGAQLDMGAFEA